MRAIALGTGVAHVAVEGPAEGPALVFSNSLGTDLRVWDRLLSRLPGGLRVIRYDTRGHGLSAAPPRPWRMEDLADDLAAILDRLGVSGAVICGLSVGGMVAQMLAARRLDLVRALVLCDTAVKIATPDAWAERIAAVEAGGVAALSDAVLDRWFPPAFHRDRADELALWRAMLERTAVDGYAGVCEAIRDADLLESTSALRLPTLALAGDHDKSTPPDLVRETAALIPGSRFEIVRGAGHLPCVDRPDETAALIAGFLRGIGHV
jgi:3-oxoadipate enol-lactonase